MANKVHITQVDENVEERGVQVRTVDPSSQYLTDNPDVVWLNTTDNAIKRANSGSPEEVGGGGGGGGVSIKEQGAGPMYVILDDDGYDQIVLTSPGAVVRMPVAANNSGRYIKITSLDGAGGSLLLGTDSALIDGETTGPTFKGKGDFVVLRSDGAAWEIVESSLVSKNSVFVSRPIYKKFNLTFSDDVDGYYQIATSSDIPNGAYIAEFLLYATTGLVPSEETCRLYSNLYKDVAGAEVLTVADFKQESGSGTFCMNTADRAGGVGSSSPGNVLPSDGIYIRLRTSTGTSTVSGQVELRVAYRLLP